jgi:riboflavin biosynthesis pyrimidine reductase
VNSFEAFVARKTAEAETAAINRFSTDVEDADAELLAFGNDWSRQMFDGAFYASPAPGGELPATSLVFVRSRDGNTAAKDPSSLGGGEADTHLVYEGLSRVAADAVLGGAGTIRDGHLVLSVWRPELVALRASLGLPRHPIQVVATIRGLDLDHGLMFNTPELRVIMITLPGVADAMSHALRPRPWMSVVTIDTAGDVAAAFRSLRALGVGRVSCIGGRTLAGGLIDAGLVQDVYLTTSPKPGGEPGTPFYSGRLQAREIVRKHGTRSDEGVVFQHLRLC